MHTLSFFVSELFLPDPHSSIPTIIQLCLIGAVEYTAVVFSVLIDLWSGVRKSRRNGLKRTSRGFRRTVGKLSSYLTLMGMLSAIDVAIVLSCIFLRTHGITTPPPFLWLTSLGAAGHIVIETTSILENIEHGRRLKMAFRKVWRLYSKRRDSDATF